MKLKFSYLYILIISVFCATNTGFAQNPEGFVVEGERFDGLIIGKSTMDDVFVIYGNDYKIIKHKEYSYQIIYKDRGLSFYSCKGDPNKEIFSIDIQLPFKATTAKGIVLGESTFADVLRIYGETERNNEYEGVAFFADEENFEEEIKKSEKEDKLKTDAVENNIEIAPKSFVIDRQEFVIDNSEIGETRTGNINPGNNLNENTEDVSEIESEQSEKNKIVKRIQLFEKSSFPRQCNAKYRK